MLDDARLHQHLIGKTGSRRELNTPVLVVDRDALQRNIELMAGLARANGVALRPHAKTHKSVDIARLQIAAGAVGICCAKLGEGEALAAGGIDSILITSPVVTSPALDRLAALNARMRDLAVVVDTVSNVTALANVTAGVKLNVLIDIDPGVRRTGVTSIDAAIEVLQAIQANPHLAYRGVQFYVHVDRLINPPADGFFLEVKSRTWSRRDASDKAAIITELLEHLGARPDETIEGGYVEL